jgi:ribosome-associated protein
MIEINNQLSIPEDELTFTASRAGGPGGQHVNKVSTRVTLRFDVAGSPWLSAAQKNRIAQQLATRMTREGVLRVACGKHRSQAANRAEAVERFAELLREALKRRKRRRSTKVPEAERKRRLEQKRRRARLKQRRGRPDPDSD